jgi:hypothetical protein
LLQQNELRAMMSDLLLLLLLGWLVGKTSIVMTKEMVDSKIVRKEYSRYTMRLS